MPARRVIVPPARTRSGAARKLAVYLPRRGRGAQIIPDEEAVPIIFDLMEHEGLCLGGSSGVNVAGAIRLAKELGPGKTIVTILCDGGTRYQSKLFNPEFMRAKNLPVPDYTFLTDSRIKVG